MGLNETLDRLKQEREQREQTDSAVPPQRLHPLVQDYAVRIFFERHLKEINPGMSEPKIEAMIDRSIMIATKLCNKIFNNQ